MEGWKRLAREAVTSPEELAAFLSVDAATVKRVHGEFPLRISRHYLRLIRERGGPIWRQAIPDSQELADDGFEDPLAEEDSSPVRQIIHRYPDRALFYVSSACAMYCRFCTRKRRVGHPSSVDDEGIEEGLGYLARHAEIRDVILSGGDPLMLDDGRIDYILARIRKMEHVQIIRVGTRVPVTLPQRITGRLCETLKKYHPLYVNTHFNHPREVTAESTRACTMLADAGIPLGNQSVLLRGVNDRPDVMRELVHKLLALRVRPYYIFQCDPVVGTKHFRVPVTTGLEIIRALRGHTSGMAVPTYVIDAPGGGGKIALAPDPVVAFNGDEIVLENYEGRIFRYPGTTARTGTARIAAGASD